MSKRKIIEVWDDGSPGLSLVFLAEGLPFVKSLQLEAMLRRMYEESKAMNNKMFQRQRKDPSHNQMLNDFRVDNEIDDMTGG